MNTKFQARVMVHDEGLIIEIEEVTHDGIWTALRLLVNTYQFVSNVSADRLEPDGRFALTIQTVKRDHPTFVVVPGGTGRG